MRFESENNKLKSKNTKLEEKVKQSQDEINRTIFEEFIMIL